QLPESASSLRVHLEPVPLRSLLAALADRELGQTANEPPPRSDDVHSRKAATDGALAESTEQAPHQTDERPTDVRELVLNDVWDTSDELDEPTTDTAQTPSGVHL